MSEREALKVADLESQLAEATAGNAAFLKAGYSDEGEFHSCRYCNRRCSKDEEIEHRNDCITQAEHPGSKWLEKQERDKKRLAAAEKLVKRLNVEREVVREMISVLKDCDEDEGRMALNTIEEAVVKEPT